jgi:hypothetical protein
VACAQDAFVIGRDSAVANHLALDEYAHANGVKVALGLKLRY